VRERFNIRREITQSSPEPTEAPAEDLLSAILSKPSGGAAAPKQSTSSDLGNLISDLVRPHLISVDENEQSGMMLAVDEATSGLMRKILHHKRFQELEAAWRGLYFLVRRTETSSNLSIYILDVSKDELAADLKSAASLEDTVLYRHLVKDAYEGDPWAVFAGNYGFVPEVDDIATLMRISKVASIGKVPFISHMRPDVVGVHSLFENSNVRDWDLSTESNAGKLWAALRDQTDSAYLGMTIPRFLARLPYGADTEPLETFNFEEFSDSPAHDEYCWANSAFVATQLLGQSFSTYEWEMGRALKQDVEDLPVHIYKDGTETVYKPCGEVLLTEEACNKLMSHGLMPLVSFKNTDRVKLAMFQSIADTKLKGRWAS
jgi:type VI secretion system protein ImpC